MPESKLSFLTWLAIANTTISSRNFLSVSNTNAMLLPRQMFSTFHFDKLKFTKITNIVSYQNLLFSRCFTDQSSFFKVKSYAPLSIEASTFQEGKFEAIGRNVHVRKSKFHMKSNNFFKVEDSGLASYEFVDFLSSSTSKPALMLKKVQQVSINICNFSKVAAGALKTSNIKFTKINFGVFIKCQSDIGSAIYSDSTEFISEQSFFVDCTAKQSGGSIYFTKNNLDTQLITNYFLGNKSPHGDSIFNEGQLELLKCVFTGDLKTEIVGDHKSYGSKFNANRRQISVITPIDTPTPPYATIARPSEDLSLIPRTIDNSKKIFYTIAIAVVCVVIVVIVGFIVYWRMKKQRNTIYADDKEPKDENEMGTVEIKAKYLLSKAYSNL